MCAQFLFAFTPCYSFRVSARALDPGYDWDEWPQGQSGENYGRQWAKHDVSSSSSGWERCQFLFIEPLFENGIKIKDGRSRALYEIFN